MTTHDITITGDVQDVGLRTQIVGLGHGQRRRGIVYNVSDDVVRILANGEDVDSFVDGIRAAVEDTGAEVEDIHVRTFDVEVNLPRFSRVRTDDLGDFSRKFDVGIGILDDIRDANQSIKADTERLESIEEETARLETIEREVGQLESIKADTERLESIERDVGRLASIEEETARLETIEREVGQLESIKADTERLESIEGHTGELVKQQSEFLETLADES